MTTGYVVVTRKFSKKGHGFQPKGNFFSFCTRKEKTAIFGVPKTKLSLFNKAGVENIEFFEIKRFLIGSTKFELRQ